MDQSTFIKKLAIWVAIVGAVIALVIGLCFGKQVETTLFGEISKWIVMSALVIGIVECFIFSTLGGIIYHFWYEKRQKPGGKTPDLQTVRDLLKEKNGLLEDSCASEECAYRGKGVCTFITGQYCPLYTPKAKK